MRNEKFVLIFLVLICSVIIVLYSSGMRKEFRSALEDRKSGEETIDRLQAQLTQMAKLKESVGNSEAMLRDELARERMKAASLDEGLNKSADQVRDLTKRLSLARADRRKVEELQAKVQELQEKLAGLSARNEDLQKGISDVRKKFELVEPIREKLAGIEEALGALELKKNKQELLNAQVESISQELKSVNNYMLQLLENNISPIRDYPAIARKPEDGNIAQSAQGAQESKEEIEKLKERLAAQQTQQVLLKQLYQDAQAELEQNHKELNDRAEKIFTLQEKVMRMENNLFQMQANSKEMEKDAAVMKEKYVSQELEKSGLQIALDQTRQELAQLQGKFLSLLARIGGIFKSSEETAATKSPANKPDQSKNPKIDVELIPQEAK
jgi:uncharacterized coiled-coil DUF342 family protein